MIRMDSGRAVLLVLVGLAICVGIALSSTGPQVQVATFDDLDSSMCPRVYQGLEWHFDIASGEDGGNIYSHSLRYIDPASWPNVAISRHPSVQHKRGTIMIAGNTSSFDLHSFHFACTHLRSRRTQDCGIMVFGLSVEGHQIYAGPLGYEGHSLESMVPMRRVTMPRDFRKLHEATIVVMAFVQVLDDVVLNIDSVEHVNYF